MTLALQLRMLQCVFQRQGHKYLFSISWQFPFSISWQWNVFGIHCKGNGNQGQHLRDPAWEAHQPKKSWDDFCLYFGDHTKEKYVYSKQNASCPKAYTSKQILFCCTEKKKTLEKQKLRGCMEFYSSTTVKPVLTLFTL